MHINDSDIPAAEVLEYFLKESSYFDQHTATYHTKVTALCPVLKRADDFGGADAKYPMFWVKYDDIASFLAANRKQLQQRIYHERGRLFRNEPLSRQDIQN